MVMESRQLLPELILSRTQENSIRDDEAGPISNLIPKQENRMDPSNKSKRRALRANYIFITAADVLRWWHKKDALKKQVATELSTQSISDMFVALMAWEDDGGSDDPA